jgi:hypothetical protein
VYAWVEDERGALKRMKPWRNAKQQNFLPHSIEEQEKEKKKEALVDSIVAILHCQFKEQTQVQLNCVRGISFEPMSF